MWKPTTIACLAAGSATALGAPVSLYTETFNADNAACGDVDSNPAGWAPAGGPAGSA